MTDNKGRAHPAKGMVGRLRAGDKGRQMGRERHRRRTGYVIEILGILSRGRNPRLNMSTWDCPHYIANWEKKKHVYFTPSK